MNRKAFLLSAIAVLSRRYPLYSGCGSLASRGFFRKLAEANGGSRLVRTPGGIMLVPMGDYVGRALYYFGDLDPKLTWLLKRLVSPGDTVLDIGANLGLVTLLLAKQVGADGHVVAFEPNPSLCADIEGNLARNHVKNVTLKPMALGAEEEDMMLTVPRGNYGAGSLLDHHASDDTAERIKVRSRRLDEVVADLHGRISFIKLDVEGFELNILKGAVETLKRARPMIVFEWNELAGHDATAELRELLESCDYEIYAVPRCLMRMRVEKLPPDAAITSHDLLACPRGHDVSRLRIKRPTG